MTLEPHIFALLAVPLLIGVAVMLVVGHFRRQSDLDNLIERRAILRVKKHFPARFPKGPLLIRPGTEFRLMSADNVIVWCRTQSKGEIFIINRSAMVECIQEDRVEVIG